MGMVATTRIGFFIEYSDPDNSILEVLYDKFEDEFITFEGIPNTLASNYSDTIGSYDKYDGAEVKEISYDMISDSRKDFVINMDGIISYFLDNKIVYDIKFGIINYVC